MGIGSKIKRAIRKVIPNEAAELAVKAAPFVAPFNPGIAAAMAGLGTFDQTGRIGESLKAGIGTYAGGKIMRGIGGAKPQSSFFGGTEGGGIGSYFTSPFTGEAVFGPEKGSFFRGEGSIFGDLPADEASSAVSDSVNVATGSGDTLTSIEPVGNIEVSLTDGVTIDGVPYEEALASPQATVVNNEINKVMSENPTFADKVVEFLNINEEGKAASLIQMALSEKGIMIGRGLIAALLTEESNKDQPQFLSYEEMPTDMYNLQYKDNLRDTAAKGGIIGLANGGEPAMEMDYRGGGFIPVGAKERADDVPARLSKNEFVMTADAVRAAGGGSVDVGAQRMYDLMNKLEARA